ncbi:hypothetical protein D3C78_1212500 [compost metagenome]
MWSVGDSVAPLVVTVVFRGLETKKSPVFRLGFLNSGGADGETGAVRLKHKVPQAGTELPVASRSPVCGPLFP